MELDKEKLDAWITREQPEPDTDFCESCGNCYPEDSLTLVVNALVKGQRRDIVVCQKCLKYRREEDASERLNNNMESD